ncbi:MAG: hypothetical protein ACXWIJ_12520 [Burkholderiales bacterium]
MTISAYPPNVAEDATSLLIFSGPPNVSVQWTLTGSGFLTPGEAYTDASGHAHAIYTPGTAGDVVTIEVKYGT